MNKQPERGQPMRLEAGEMERLAAFGRQVEGAPAIDILVTKNARSPLLEDFCRLLQQAIPALRVHKNREDTMTPPHLKVGEGVYYQALPLARELEPFLETLQAAARGEDQLAPLLRHRLAAMDVPAALRLYISSRCAFCPEAVRQLVPLAAWGDARLIIIDAELFPELATEENIRSVPTLLLGGDFRWSGKMDIEEIVEAAAGRDPCHMGVSVLRGMLEEGRAARIAEIMIACGQVLPALVELLLHPKWPVRLGAMVTVEWVAEKDADLAGRVVRQLWKRFGDVADQVRGDIVYLTGEFGGRQWRARLKSIRDGAFPPELKEATREALEKLDAL